MYDGPNLTHQHLLYLRERFNSFNPSSFRLEETDFEKRGKSIYLKYQDAKLAIRYNGKEGEDLVLELFYTRNKVNKTDINVESLKSEVLGMDDSSDYFKIFDVVSAGADKRDFLGEMSVGVTVKANVKKVPRGKMRGLSDDIFNLTHRFLVSSLEKIVR